MVMVGRRERRREVRRLEVLVVAHVRTGVGGRRVPVVVMVMVVMRTERRRASPASAATASAATATAATPASADRCDCTMSG